MSDASDLAQRLAQSVQTLEKLKGLKARVEGEYDMVAKDLETAEQEAVAKYGTSDPDQLRAIADEVMRSAEQSVDTFEEQVGNVRDELAEIGISI